MVGWLIDRLITIKTTPTLPLPPTPTLLLDPSTKGSSLLSPELWPTLEPYPSSSQIAYLPFCWGSHALHNLKHSHVL